MATHTDSSSGEKSARSNAAEGDGASAESARKNAAGQKTGSTGQTPAACAEAGGGAAENSRKTAGVEVGDEEAIAEVELARAAGVTREDLKKMRAALIEGEDWSGGGGRAVLIHASGRRKLEAMLAERVLDGTSRSEGDDSGSGKNAALAGVVTLGRPAYVTLVVHERTLAVKNKRLVLAVVERAPAETPEILPLQQSQQSAGQGGYAGSGDARRMGQLTPPAPEAAPHPASQNRSQAAPQPMTGQATKANHAVHEAELRRGQQPTPPAPEIHSNQEGKRAQEELVRVDVKDAALFKPGMRLERCLPSKAFPGFYHYHGRMPRRRGKF